MVLWGGRQRRASTYLGGPLVSERLKISLRRKAGEKGHSDDL